MPYVETYYDYEIHRECFRVSDSPGYTHSTDTILKNISIESVYKNYFTALFSLDVIRNLGNGKVGIYDNDELLKLVTFNEQTEKITNLSLNLAYEIQHNIEARFMGNDECLPSNSILIPLYQDMPSGYIADMYFMFNNSEVQPGEINVPNPSSGSQSFGVLLTDDENYPIPNATVSFSLSNPNMNTITTTVTTDQNGIAVGISDIFEYGVYELTARFEGNNVYSGLEENLKVFLGVSTSAVQSKVIAGQKPSITVHAEDFTSSPVQQTFSLWYGD